MPAERERRRYLNHAQLLQLAKAIERFETLPLVLGCCGRRLGAAAALQRKHVSDRELLVRSSATYSTGRGIVESTTNTNRVKGDLFDNEAEHLVITICDTFDTATPDIIERKSLQGQAPDRIYNNNTAQLDEDLTAALNGIQPIETVNKKGKTLRYPVGTVAIVDQTRRNSTLSRSPRGS